MCSECNIRVECTVTWLTIVMNAGQHVRIHWTCIIHLKCIVIQIKFLTPVEFVMLNCGVVLGEQNWAVLNRADLCCRLS